MEFVKDQVYRTPVGDLADSQEIIYVAVNNVTPQMFHYTWVEVEFRLDISLAINGSYVKVSGTQGKKIPAFTLCSNWFHL